MADPIHKALIRVPGLFGHERNIGRLHWVIVSDLACREEWTVGKVDSFNKRIEFWSRLIVFLSNPVKVASFFASVAEEARLLSTIEGEWLVAIHEFIQLIDPFILKDLLNNQSKISRLRYFIHNICLSCLNLLDLLWTKLNDFLCSDFRLFTHLFSFFDIFHCSYHNALIYVEFGELYLSL